MRGGRTICMYACVFGRVTAVFSQAQERREALWGLVGSSRVGVQLSLGLAWVPHQARSEQEKQHYQ